MNKLTKFLSKGILITLLALIICFGFSSPSLAFGPSNDIILDGIDVSDWQGDIDFNAVKQSGVDIVYIKAGQGGYEDAMLESNYAKAKAAGLNIGFYYYLTARTTQEAAAQATNFADILQGKDTDSLPAMDFESFGNLNHQEVNEIALTFMETLAQATGRTPLIYSDLYNARDLFDEQLAAYPLWIAEYGASSPGDPGKWDAWVGFQYSSSGSVPGIDGRVDMDKFTADALIKIDGFIDIAASWAEEDIVFMVKEKLMEGTSPLLFSPDLALNRAMMVTILWRLDGQPAANSKTPFTDVAEGQYYSEAVAWAYENDIVTGTSSELFSPMLAATREQVATILYRYSEYKGYDTSVRGSLADFADAGQVSAYAMAPMEWAVGEKLIEGEANKLLAPQGIATRAQTAALFHRFIETIVQ